jgi:hypothetical protein
VSQNILFLAAVNMFLIVILVLLLVGMFIIYLHTEVSIPSFNSSLIS